MGTKLSAYAKNTVLAAAELVASGENMFSCDALGYPYDDAMPIIKQYKDFCGVQTRNSFWLDAELDAIADFETDRKELRVLLLLTFLEANK